MANPLYGQNSFDGHMVSAKFWENKLALNSWNFGHLTIQLAADTTEAKSRSGITLVDGQLCESLGVADTGAAATTLPAAKVGGLTVYRHAAQFDGGQNHVISCASGETFKAGNLNVAAGGAGAGTVMSPNYHSVNTPTVGMAGGTIVNIAFGNNTLTYAGSATNNQTMTGAEWAFFCEEEGVWTPAFRGVELGDGSVNGSLAFSTV